MREKLEEIYHDLKSFYKLNEKKQNNFLVEEEIHTKLSKFTQPKEYYREKIFHSYDPNVIHNLDLSIEFVKTPEQRELWNYLKIVTTSAHTSEKTIKEFKILLKDNHTNKYLGIINLGPDIYCMKDRDDFIGWNYENKRERVHLDNHNDRTLPRISYLINIQCCVGLQPIAYNLNIGKLLVMIVFSREVLEEYYRTFGHYYAGVVTLSLYGKSIQYDRLKEIKFIGMTKGYGASHLPQKIILKIINFMKEYYMEKLKSLKKGMIDKMRTLQFFVREFDFFKNIVFHKKQRGIYFGYTGNNNHLFFQGHQDHFNLDKVRDLHTIVEDWKNRYAIKRWEHLQKEHRVKIMFELKDMTEEELKNEKNKQYNYTRYHSDPEFRKRFLEKQREKYIEKRLETDINHHKKIASIQKRTVLFHEIIEMIKWKRKMIYGEKFLDNKKISKRKVSLLLSEIFQKEITEGMIKKYWNGQSPLYDFEFEENESDLTYENYIEIINHQNE